MTVDVGKWIRSGKRYRLKSYNCWHFFSEVWLEATGEDMSGRVPAKLCDYRGKMERDKQERVRLDSPAPLCIAYYPNRRVTPHVGVYCGDGVLHLSTHGVSFDRPAQMNMAYGEAEYYL